MRLRGVEFAWAERRGNGMPRDHQLRLDDIGAPWAVTGCAMAVVLPVTRAEELE